VYYIKKVKYFSPKSFNDSDEY